MKFKYLIIAGIVSTFAACSSAPISEMSFDSEMSDYRVFLSDLSRLSDPVSQGVANSSNLSDIMWIRDQLYLVMGNARSFSEMSYAQHNEFSALTKQLYMRICSERSFAIERARLYEMLVAPDYERQFASI